MKRTALYSTAQLRDVIFSDSLLYDWRTSFRMTVWGAGMDAVSVCP